MAASRPAPDERSSRLAAPPAQSPYLTSVVRGPRWGIISGERQSHACRSPVICGRGSCPIDKPSTGPRRNQSTALPIIGGTAALLGQGQVQLFPCHRVKGSLRPPQPLPFVPPVGISRCERGARGVRGVRGAVRNFSASVMPSVKHTADERLDVCL